MDETAAPKAGMTISVRMRQDVVIVDPERFGRLAADPPASAGLPGRGVLDRPDGLSPAGEYKRIMLNDPQPLQDHGCSMPEGYDPFAVPPGR